jgi:hypothetical protein
VKTMVAVLARALYVAAHWQDTITEHDRDRKPQAEYERRAGEKWDAGNAGWSPYQQYPRLAEAGITALTAAGFGPVTAAAAGALRAAADAIESGFGPINPRRTDEWLIARAATIEAAE